MRRIDELGRIVIPKDIRSAMRLKAGDNVEVDMCDDFISITRAETLKGMERNAEIITRAVGECMDVFCVLSNLSNVIAVSDGRMNYLIGSKLSDLALDIIERRKPISKIYDDLFSKSIGMNVLCACPIAINGEALGLIAICDEKERSFDVSFIETIAMILAELN